MPRRREGRLLEIETEILRALREAERAGDPAHGFRLAELLQDARGRALTAHGTLYKALARLHDAGLVTASWEDPEAAHAERRPRRKCYSLTPAGEHALASVPRPAAAVSARPATGAA